MTSSTSSSDRHEHGDIGIVGMACRFPGAADLDAFWQLLNSGRDAIGPMPSSRWPIDAWKQAIEGFVEVGGFLDEIAEFDPQVFGISPREAAAMDPQQRLLLEVCWEALEHANVSPRELRDRDVGVYLGIGASEYDVRFQVGPASADGALYSGIGNDSSFASGRVSTLLGLRGPSMSINTACSSALVALDLALQDLRRGACDAAIVGAVNLAVVPENTARLSKMGVLAPDGRCKAFDASADGYGRGEGAGAVVLMRTDEADRSGVRVRAVVRGMASNQDAGDNGLVAPSPRAQEELVRAALADAGLTADDIDVIEAHGTGTPTGDPIELRALASVFGEREAGRPLVLGSAKTQVGHLEVAAGIVGLIKAVLSLENEAVPPHLHLSDPIERPDAFLLPQRTRKWKRGDRPRRIGVSAFGMSGTNCHLILEEGYEPSATTGGAEVDRPLHLLPLSAYGEEPLRQLARETANRIFDVEHIADLCHTAGVGRAHGPQRLAITAGTPGELGKRLVGFADAKQLEGVEAGFVRPVPPKVAFLFSGQGSLTRDLGRTLRETSPVFEEALQQCEAIAAPLMGRSLLDEMFPATPGDPIRDTELQQPALLALGHALATLWRSWGVEPTCVLGHSVGELGACVTAGILSLSDAMTLAVERGKLMQALPEGGAMHAVFADAAVVEPHLEPHRDKVSIAAINSPTLLTLSGEADAVRAVAEALDAAGVDGRPLRVSHAFHSPLMDPCLDELEKLAGTITHHAPRHATFVSTVRGEAVEQALDSAYWRDHAAGTVRFHDAMDQAIELGCTAFLEMGAQPVLVDMARRARKGTDSLWLASQRDEIDPWEVLLHSLSQLYIAGVDPDWRGFDAPYARRRVDLPLTPYQRRRMWLDGATSDRPDQVVQAAAPAAPATTTTTAEAAADPAPTTPAASGPVGNADVPRTMPDHAPDHWFWEMSWRPVPAMPAADGEGTWLVLSDHSGIGEAVVGALPGALRVELAATTGPLSGDRFGIAPDDPHGFDAMMQHFAVPLQNCRGAVYLWGLDQRPAAGVDAADDVVAGATQALRLAQALISQLRQRRPDFRLWLVSRAAHARSDGEPVDATQAGLWGLGRCIALEHPELQVGNVDLDASGDPASLVALLGATTDEDQLLLRGQEAYGARVTQAPAAPQPLEVRGDGAVLITGGLGALGLQFARWLAEHGAHRLVLFGRSAPKPHAQRAIDELRGYGVDVQVASCDVTDPSALRSLIDGLGVPITGVVHSAGVLDDGVLVHQDLARFQKVMGPKVHGTLALAEATRGQPLSFFVMCSSISSMFGAPGQANYSTANAFMDSYAAQLRRQGVPAVSINWGPWAEAGMATDHIERIASRGLRPLPSAEASAALGQALAAGSAVGVVDIDAAQLANLGPRFRNRPMLRELLGDESVAAAGPATATGILGQLQQAGQADREPLLHGWIAHQIASGLGMDAGDISADKPLTWHGFDSLMAVELKRTIDDNLGTDVPNQMLQSGPSVRQIVEGVLPLLPDGAAPAAAQAAAPVSTGSGPAFARLPSVPRGQATQPAVAMAATLGSANSSAPPPVPSPAAAPGAAPPSTTTNAPVPAAGGMASIFSAPSSAAPGPTPPQQQQPAPHPQPPAQPQQGWALSPGQQSLESPAGQVPQRPAGAPAGDIPMGARVALGVLLLATVGLGYWVLF